MARKTNVSQIHSALTKLTPEELAAVKAACTHLGASGSVSNSPTSNKSTDLDENFQIYYSVLEELMLNQGYKIQGWVAADRSKKLVKGWMHLEEYMSVAFKKRWTKRRRLKFYKIAIQIVIDYLIELEIPVTANTYSRHMQNCAGLINRQFPGYIESGITDLILDWGRPEQEE